MNLFKLLGNLGNLTKIQQEMAAAADELAELRFEGKAGGDMVVVEVSGAQKLLTCSIDPKLFDDNERELVEDLVVTAVNDALSQAKKQTAELMQQKLAERLNMPEMGDLLKQFMPKS